MSRCLYIGVTVFVHSGDHTSFTKLKLPSGLQLWVEERMPLATSTDHGNNLQTVQLAIKKNQVPAASHESRRPPPKPLTRRIYNRCLDLLTRSDPAEGDPGPPAALRRHLPAQPARPEGERPHGRAHPPAPRRAAVAVGADQEGDGEAPHPPQRGPRGPAVLLRRRRGRGLDERTGAVHDVRGEGQGEAGGSEVRDGDLRWRKYSDPSLSKSTNIRQ